MLIYIDELMAKNFKTELYCIQLLIFSHFSQQDQEMASSAMSSHIRSNSLPSTPHPFIAQVQDHLCRLRSSSEATSTSSSSISHQLNVLQDVHECVDELLLLPIAHGSINGLVDGSLRLLDVCNIIKDALLQTKESAHEMQSVLRRRSCDAQSEIKKFISTRKMVKKAIQKALKSLKDMGNKSSLDDETVTLLEEAQAHTVLVLESLLSFINGQKSSSKSFVSKILRSKRVASEDEEENEFAKVDAAVQSLMGHKGSIENAQNQLKELDLCIQDFEEGVESLFRHLIKTRVSLLNIINH